MNSIPRVTTLRDNPRLVLTSRANRLNRLCELKAPTIILRGEVSLILQALEEVIKQEEPNFRLSDDMVGALRSALTKDRGPDQDGANADHR